MRRIAWFWALFLPLVIACSDFHGSDNGNLDGFWQLTQVDTLSSGRLVDARQKMIFWSFQSRLLQMRDLHDMIHAYHTISFRFSREQDSLRLFEPFIDNREISDSIVVNERTLWFYGIYSLDERFKVLQLEESRMTLQSNRLRMYFRKY